MTSNAFELELTRDAEKDLDRLKGFRDRATRVLLQLEQNPFAGHALSGSLRGARSLEFSLPGGAYRAVYVVFDAERVCLVFIVGLHENIYKKAERRYQALLRSGRL